MKTWSITALGKAFGLARSTLLYYHKIGILPPAGRKPNGYRFYSQSHYRQLERVCSFRAAGLSLKDIKALLQSKLQSAPAVIEKRLRETWLELRKLKSKQRLLMQMLKQQAGGCPPDVDKKMWVELMRAAGIDDRSMDNWHSAFEKRAPEAHHEFLLSLGISENEALQIRAHCLKKD